MGAQIHHHIRSNVVGYVALFFALSGGAAWATHPGGANTISSGDIINDEVKTQDIAAGHVTSQDIGTGEVLSEDIGNGQVSLNDLAANSVSSGKIVDGGIQNADVQNNSLTGTKVQDDTLTGDDVADGSLTDADTSGLVPYGDVLWAVVNADGTLNRASNATTTSVLEAAGTGDYEVAFGNGNLDPCASIGQISDSGFPFDELPGEVGTAQGEDVAGTIDVRTFDSAGAAADRGFTVHVLCPEGFGGAAFAASADRDSR